MGASSPGLESTRTWGFEQISYFSEPQFSHLQKGYDNIHGQRTAVRVKERSTLSASESALHM